MAGTFIFSVNDSSVIPKDFNIALVIPIPKSKDIKFNHSSFVISFGKETIDLQLSLHTILSGKGHPKTFFLKTII